MFSAVSVRHSVHRGGGGVHVTITHNALAFIIEGPLFYVDKNCLSLFVYYKKN